MYDIGWILNWGGIEWGYLVFVVIGIISGILGYVCSNKDSRLLESFAILFFVVCWLYLGGLSLYQDLDMRGWWLSLIFIIIGSLIFWGTMTEWVYRTSFLRKIRGGKLFIISIFMFFSVAFYGVFWAPEIFLISYTPHERVGWWIKNGIMDSSVDHKKVFVALDRLDRHPEIKVSNYFKGVACLKAKEHEKAFEYFHEYAKERPAEERNFWYGFIEYVKNKDYPKAERYFEKVSEGDFLLVTLLRVHQLTPEKFDEILSKKKIIYIPKKNIEAVQGLPGDAARKYESLVSGDDGKLPYPDPQNDLEKAMNKFAELRGMLSGVLGETEGSHGGLIEVDQEVQKKFIGKILAELQDASATENEKCLWAGVLARAPQLSPLPPFQFEWWFFPSGYLVWCVTMFVTNMVLRDYRGKFSITPFMWAKRIVGKACCHSVWARRMAAKIDSQEPEPALFFREVQKIHAALFPWDIWLGIYYTIKLKSVLRGYALESEERKNIEDIKKRIHLLGGEIIPAGDESVLETVMAFRDQVQSHTERYIKREIKYIECKALLFGVLRELVMVHAIVQACESRLTHYDFLGVKPNECNGNGEEIKKAYREIIKVIHPDLHHDKPHLGALSKRVVESYTVLHNPDSKAMYDQEMGFTHQE